MRRSPPKLHPPGTTTWSYPRLRVSGETALLTAQVSLKCPLWTPGLSARQGVPTSRDTLRDTRVSAQAGSGPQPRGRENIRSAPAWQSPKLFTAAARDSGSFGFRNRHDGQSANLLRMRNAACPDRKTIARAKVPRDQRSASCAGCHDPRRTTIRSGRYWSHPGQPARTTVPAALWRRCGCSSQWCKRPVSTIII